MNCKHCGSFIENEEANVCPFCGKEPSWQAVIFNWPFQDNGNTRTFYIPDDYVCCNNNHVIRTKIIYKGKAYKFDHLKIKNICPLTPPVRRVMKQSHKQENMFLYANPTK